MKRLFVIAASVLLLTTTALTGCSSGDDSSKSTGVQKTDTGTTNVKFTGYKQSPILADKNLPAVKDRLPVHPKLTNEMPPDQLKYEIGTYGGTLRTVTTASGWDADVFIMDNEALLNTPGIVGKQITGNIVEGYDVTPDQKTFTFHMRKGLKWSDGQPVTVEDVRFTVEDVLFNKELNPVFPAWLCAGGDPNGEPMKFQSVDDYTFKISFVQPYGGFPARLAIQGWRGYTDLLKPAHYLKQFHKKYADAADLAAKIKAAKFHPGEWTKLFTSKDVSNWELTAPKAIGFPVLYPWMLVKSTQTTEYFERNPYYFKVDAAGNQLPYIDKIQSTLVQNMDMVVMKTLAGEVDFSRESAALVKMPLYKQYEQKGHFKALLTNMHVTPTDIFLNLNYKDPSWRKVVQDIRFRKALNMALNRKDIINSIYYGFAQPSKMEDPTYNLDAANKLLDDMGMKKGPDGIRLGPDGKQFSIPFEVAAIAPDIIPLTELVVSQWKELGLNVTMKTLDSTLWGQRGAANQVEATVSWVHTPLWYMGDWGQGNWGPLWSNYHGTAGKQGEKPPADVANFLNLIDQVSVATPTDAQKAIEQVKAQLGENLWFFVPIENVKQPLIVNDKLGNVTDKGYAIAVDFSGEQFFFKK